MRRTSGRSAMLSRQAPETTRGNSGGSSKATEDYVRGEYSKDIWVPCDGVASSSWWFLSEVVSVLTISVGSNLSGWVKRSIG